MKSLSLVALLAAAAFTPAAFGQSANSTVTFSNFHYTLTDLTPDDGLAPSATFTFRTFLFVTGEDLKFSKKRYSTDDVVTQNLSMNMPGATFYASTTAGTGQQHLNGASAYTYGSAIITGNEKRYGDTQYNYYSSSASVCDGTFTLAPGTKITFYADVYAFASSDTGVYTDQSVAYATGWLGGFDGHHDVVAEVQANAIHHGDYGLKTEEKTQSLELSFSNYNAEPFTSYVYAGAQSSGTAVDMAPVPEPSTYAMFFAGLGLIAFAKRRRT